MSRRNSKTSRIAAGARNSGEVRNVLSKEDVLAVMSSTAASVPSWETEKRCAMRDLALLGLSYAYSSVSGRVGLVEGLCGDSWGMRARDALICRGCGDGDRDSDSDSDSESKSESESNFEPNSGGAGGPKTGAPGWSFFHCCMRVYTVSGLGVRCRRCLPPLPYLGSVIGLKSSAPGSAKTYRRKSCLVG